MTRTKIEWAERTWNPVRGCSRVSEGCRNCYAERQAARFSGEGQPWNGFVRWQSRVSGLQYENPKAAGSADPRWTGRVELIPEKLTEPLSWQKPARVFVNSMSDLFHESLSDEAIAAVFVAMAAAPQHQFLVLTKRAKRMRRWFSETITGATREQMVRSPIWIPKWPGWPLPNVWLGVSVEDQSSADERIPHLLATPAAKRVVSYEPALGPVDFRNWIDPHGCHGHSAIGDGSDLQSCDGCIPYIDWVIVGGESGPGARPCDVAWIRSAVEQCKAAGVPCFVKQLGATPAVSGAEADPKHATFKALEFGLRSRKGGDPSEWPEDLRVREWP